MPDLKSLHDFPVAHVPSVDVASRQAAVCDAKMETQAAVHEATACAAPNVHSNRIRHDASQPALSEADGPSGSESPQLAGNQVATARVHSATNERSVSQRQADEQAMPQMIRLEETAARKTMWGNVRRRALHPPKWIANVASTVNGGAAEKCVATEGSRPADVLQFET